MDQRIDSWGVGWGGGSAEHQNHGDGWGWGGVGYGSSTGGKLGEFVVLQMWDGERGRCAVIQICWKDMMG